MRLAEVLPGHAIKLRLSSHPLQVSLSEIEQLQPSNMINPTYLAQRTRACKCQFHSRASYDSANSSDSRQLGRCKDKSAQVLSRLVTSCTRSVLRKHDGNIKSNGFRDQAPEIQTMYSLNMPVSRIRTKIRQEFERHRYVAQLPTIDVLLFHSHQEFQETLNYWKQLSHVLKYFRTEEDPKAKLPRDFIGGFLEVCVTYPTASGQ